MLFDVILVELEPGLIAHARNHPDERQIRQAALLVAASHVGMRARKPDLLDPGAILCFPRHPRGRGKGSSSLVDGHRLQPVLDLVANFVVVKAAGPRGELARERTKPQPGRDPVRSHRIPDTEALDDRLAVRRHWIDPARDFLGILLLVTLLFLLTLAIVVPDLFEFVEA